MRDIDLSEVELADDAELDALLQRALDPQMPVEVFYAVLDRLARSASAWRPPARNAQAARREAPPPSDRALKAT